MQLIEGLNFDVSGSDLKTHLEGRSKWHFERAEAYSTQAAKCKKIAEEASKIQEDLSEPTFAEDALGGGLEVARAYAAPARTQYRPDQDAGRKYQQLVQQYQSHKTSGERFAAWAKYTVTTATYRLTSSEFAQAEFASEY